MSKTNGILPISANFETNFAEPLDSRVRVPTKADLLLANTWGSYSYVGMIVTVYNDSTTSNNGTYRLIASDYTQEPNWILSSSGTNTGDETTATIKTKLGEATSATDGYLTSREFSVLMDVESAAKSFYISPTGSDISGSGTSGNPYLSIHKCLRTLNKVLDTTVTIEASAGTYDFSSLGDLNLDRFQMTPRAIITVRNNSAIDSATTVIASGTFTSHTLINKGAAAVDTSDKGLIHNQSGATYTPNAYKGMILKPLTGTHTLPAAANRYVPILQNGADWIETGPMTGMSGQPYQDILNYEVRDYNVTFNFGNNKIVQTGNLGLLRFYYVKITNFGGIVNPDIGCFISTDTTNFYNSAIIYSTGATYLDKSYSSRYNYCYVNFGSGVIHQIGVILGCAFETSATNTTAANSIFWMNSSFEATNILCTNATKPHYIIRLPGKLTASSNNTIGSDEVSKVAGCQNSIFNKNLVIINLVLGGYWITDSFVKFFLTLGGQAVQNLHINVSNATYPLNFLVAEPSVGRITNDGTTDLANYYSSDMSLNALAAAVSAKNFKDYSGRNVTLSGSLILSTATTPASATAAGTTGAIVWDANYIYVCTATNTWKRVAIATW